jgi:hypothetical protein
VLLYALANDLLAGPYVRGLITRLQSLFGTNVVIVEETRERAIEAYWLLSDFVGELICGTQAFQYFDTPKFKAGATEQILRDYNKMVDSFLYMTLAKWIEFYDKYNSVIPQQQLQTCKHLRDELVERGVRDFRNQIVGHIWHKRSRRPLLISEIKDLEQRITKGDGKQFLHWINHPNNNCFGTSIVGTSESVRDKIKESWCLSEQELSSYRG